MERDYIGHVRVLAGVNNHAVYQQDLEILRAKYHLTEIEMEEIIQYCREQKITIYDAAKECISSSEDSLPPRKTVAPLTEEEKHHLTMAKIVSYKILNFASTAARKRVHYRGWLCGTYTSSVRRSVIREVQQEFTSDELQFIIDHFPTEEEAKKAIGFDMKDSVEQGLCDALNDRLNELIPELHVNPIYGWD